MIGHRAGHAPLELPFAPRSPQTNHSMCSVAETKADPGMDSAMNLLMAFVPFASREEDQPLTCAGVAVGRLAHEEKGRRGLGNGGGRSA